MVRITISIDVTRDPKRVAPDRDLAGSASPEPREDLENQLVAVEEELRDHATRWNLRFGPVRMSRRIGTQTFAWVYLFVSTALGTCGAVLILLGDNLTELGTAVVVGATFSFSTFLNEIWSQGMNRQAQAYQRRLDELHEQRNGILRSLASPPQETADGRVRLGASE